MSNEFREHVATLLRGELQDEELFRLAVCIYDAYMKGRRRAVEELLDEMLKEVCGFEGNSSEKSRARGI